MARRERSLRASVISRTRCTCHASNAWVSISSFASVSRPVRWTSGAYHVQPISTTSGRCAPRWLGLPAGHAQNSTLPKRVEPFTTPLPCCTTANGRAVPAACASSALSTYRTIAARVSGTTVKPNVAREPVAAASSGST
jgi:hypothetical protein